MRIKPEALLCSILVMAELARAYPHSWSSNTLVVPDDDHPRTAILFDPSPE